MSSKQVRKDPFPSSELVIPALLSFEPTPLPSPFVGRHSEVEKLGAWFNTENLVLVLGGGGMGKTALAAKYATSQMARGYEVFWHTSRPGMCSLQGFLWVLAAYLASSTKSGLLWEYLNDESLVGKRYPDSGKLASLLMDLRGKRILLCLDDIHLLERKKREVQFFSQLVREHRKMPFSRGDIKVLLIGRYSSLSSKHKSLVLRGMTRPDFALFCKAQKIVAEEIYADLYRYTEGNPRLAQTLVNGAHDRNLSLEELVHTMARLSWLPEIRHALQLEAQSLSRSELRLAQVISLMPLPFGMDKLQQGLANLGELDLGSKLNRLIQIALIEFADAEDGLLRMSTFHQVFYQSLLSKAQRRTVLSAIAAAT